MVAQRKALALIEAGARLVVVADRVDPNFEATCISRKIELITARYSPEYIAEAVLVIAATDDPKVNAQVYRDCQKRQILCNSVDEPQHCDFFAPAVIQRGRLQVAISTDGACPAYAGHIRKKLEELLTEDHGRFLEELEAARARVLAAISDDERRKAVMGRLVDDASFEVFKTQGKARWHQYADKLIASL